MKINVVGIRKQISALFWVYSLLLLVLAQGYIWGVGGPNYFTNLYALLVMSLISFVFLIKGVQVKTVVYIFLTVVFTFSVSTYTTSLGGNFRDDLQALVRSIVLFVFVYFFVKSRSLETKGYLIKVIVALWFTISLMIWLSSLLKVGLQTYPNFNSGWKFYFPATNELSFVYFSTYLVANCYFKARILKMCSLAITISTFLIIGTKVFIPLFFVTFLLWLLISFRKNNKQVAFYVSLFVPLLILFLVSTNFEKIALYIAEVFIGVSGGAGTLENKILVRGVTSAILGERDILIALAFEYINRTYDIWDVLFGKTISIYSSEFAIYRGLSGPGWIENDLLDLFCAYGILGMLSYLIFIFKISNFKSLFNFKTLFCDLKQLRLCQGVVFVVAGGLSGHVLFFTFPMFVTAIILGLENQE